MQQNISSQRTCKQTNDTRDTKRSYDTTTPNPNLLQNGHYDCGTYKNTKNKIIKRYLG